MCHLILILPLITLPVWWLLPLSIAAPVYGLVSIVSGGVYYLVVRAMRSPLAMGPDLLIGRRGEVVAAGAQPQIRLGGEIWEAESEYALTPGEQVEVERRERLTLVVRPLSAPSSQKLEPERPRGQAPY
ncbi:MAG: NfeD family protein [Gammaproteobacteria bacterium]|jgi:membrane protein implicated in regulation of membrane protease activity